MSHGRVRIAGKGTSQLYGTPTYPEYEHRPEERLALKVPKIFKGFHYSFGSLKWEPTSYSNLTMDRISPIRCPLNMTVL